MSKKVSLIPGLMTKETNVIYSKVFKPGENQTRLYVTTINNISERKKGYVMSNNGEKNLIKDPWSRKEDDSELLTKLYPHTETDKLAKRTGRSAGSVKTKDHQLGIKKSRNNLKAIKSCSRKQCKKKTSFIISL